MISGKIELNGRTTEFTLNDQGYQQWGADTSTLGERVDLLDMLEAAVAEWACDNLCGTCRERTLDDGEGYDGKCGDCADKSEGEDDDSDD